MNLGDYEAAEPLYQHSLATWERIQGPKHPDVARCLNNLGRLYALQGNCAEAEPRFLRARAIREQLLGPDHPDVAQTLGAILREEPLNGRVLAGAALVVAAIAYLVGPAVL